MRPIFKKGLNSKMFFTYLLYFCTSLHNHEMEQSFKILIAFKAYQHNIWYSDYFLLKPICYLILRCTLGRLSFLSIQMAISTQVLLDISNLNPNFQRNQTKNRAARALPYLAWAPPNLADRQHLAVGFCFWPFAKLFLVQLIWNFGSKLLISKGNHVQIAILLKIVWKNQQIP